MRINILIKRGTLLLGALGIMVMVFSASAWAGLTGAIFTTDVNGDRVDENIYPLKRDVYLDGGPGNNAPISAAGLPEGCYYFQVTDPSGKVLLSTDSVNCRTFHVNNRGIIDSVGCTCACPDTTVSCAHGTGVDQDHGTEGAITVQLYPYRDTPNEGGVYKVWVTPCDKYLPGSGSFGFLPAWSKTDNFKVICTCPCSDQSVVIIRTIRDSNANGILDEGDKEVGVKIPKKKAVKGGSAVSVTDPLGVVNGGHTPWQVGPLSSGDYLVSKDPGKLKESAVYLDGKAVPDAARSLAVPISGTCGERHEVIFLVH